MSHHRIALAVIAAALILDAACGVAYSAAEHIGAWLGLYNALANAVTLGGNVAPSNGWGYAVSSLECLLVIPLFAATLSLFTSGLTQLHVSRSEARIKAHVSGAVSPGEAVPLMVAGDDHGRKLDILHADLSDLSHTLRAVLLGQHQHGSRSR